MKVMKMKTKTNKTLATTKAVKLQPSSARKAAEKKIATKTAKAVKAVAEAKSRAKTFRYTGKPLEAGLSGVYGVVVRSMVELHIFTKKELADVVGKNTKSVMDPMKNVAWYMPRAREHGYCEEVQ